LAILSCYTITYTVYTCWRCSTGSTSVSLLPRRMTPSSLRQRRTTTSSSLPEGSHWRATSRDLVKPLHCITLQCLSSAVVLVIVQLLIEV
jgi:hypothetical protein